MNVIIWDYSRTAGIHFKPDGSVFVIHHPNRPFIEPQKRFSYWWPITNYDTFNADQFFTDHNLQLVPGRIYPIERPSGHHPLSSRSIDQCDFMRY